jgi:type VI secretion system protein ImpH
VKTSALARLFARPQSFAFDAAIRVLSFARRNADPAEIARFRSIPNFAFPPADITGVRQMADRPPDVTTPVMGLIGPTGVLPRHFTEAVAETLRNRSPALHHFIDTLAQRFVGGFARAGAKYRVNRAADAAVIDPATPDPVAGTLLALTGFATPGMVARLLAGPAPLLHYAGLFAMRPRSADRLAALVSDWIGRQVEVRQFAGAWLEVPPDQRTRLGIGIAPGDFSQLGIDAAIGLRAWDPQGRIVLRVGPLTGAEFDALLPDQPGLRRLVSLVRAYVGMEIGFAVNPVVLRAEVPPLVLDRLATSPMRLGWNSWLPAGGIATPGDAADAVFEAETVEAQPALADARLAA